MKQKKFPNVTGIFRLGIWGGFVWGDDNANDFLPTRTALTRLISGGRIYRHDTKDFNA
ncbi:MAG: hypothetical protein R3B95_08285 [Nitrospirales bacterium]|nr:hypothetical protein [Nitrospirales bacterium]